MSKAFAAGRGTAATKGVGPEGSPAQTGQGIETGIQHQHDIAVDTSAASIWNSICTLLRLFVRRASLTARTSTDVDRCLIEEREVVGSLGLRRRVFDLGR